MMTAEKPKETPLELPQPKLDKSKWAHVDEAKPIDPWLVIEAARAIRGNPEMWSIFTSVKPDKWISKKDGTRIYEFCRSHFESKAECSQILAVAPSITGMAIGTLRSFLTGNPKDLDDDVALLAWLRNRYQTQVLGGN